MHVSFACELYNELLVKLSQEEVEEIISDAVRVEHYFITRSIPIHLIGMNADLMKAYIEFVADFWLVRLNYKKFYNTENPFDWMELISLQGKTNFFERRVGEYQKKSMRGDKEENVFRLDVDF